MSPQDPSQSLPASNNAIQDHEGYGTSLKFGEDVQAKKGLDAMATGNQGNGRISPDEITPPANASTSLESFGEMSTFETTEVGQVRVMPEGRKDSQGARAVVFADVNTDLPLSDRPAEALRLAQEAFAQTGYWVAFYKAVLGSEGVVNLLFPSSEELDYFYTTPEFVEIQRILTALRTSDQEKADAVEPLKMITIRIPRSMQSALITESKRHNTSINKLCISKLLYPIDVDYVPAEQGRVKGRKPKA